MTPRPAEQFLNAVHRRRKLARTGDVAAVSLGIGAVAVGMGSFLFPPLAVTVVAFVAALVVELWTLARSGDRLETAADLDRELGTDDLLASSMSDPGPTTDPGFAAMVRAMADRRFAGINPAKVANPRIGMRGWAAAGLLVVASAVIVLRPRAGEPRTDVTDRSPLMAEPVRTIAMRQPALTAGPSGPRAVGNHDEEGASKIGSAQTERPAAVTAKDAGPKSGSGSASADAGGGPGESRTPGRIEKPLAGSGTPANPAGTDAGDGTARGKGGTAPAIGTRGADAAATASVPWSSPAWADAKTAADVAVANGTVPARAKSLVRDYFDGE